MINPMGKAHYEASTLRDTPRATFDWFGDRMCRTSNIHNGVAYSIDVRVWDTGSFEIVRHFDEPIEDMRMAA